MGHTCTLTKCKLPVREEKSKQVKNLCKYSISKSLFCLSGWLEFCLRSCCFPLLKLLHCGVFRSPESHGLLSSAAKLAAAAGRTLDSLFFGLPAFLPAGESSSLRSAQTPSAHGLARLRPHADGSRQCSERRRVGYLHFSPFESEDKGQEDKKEIGKLNFLSKNSFQIQHQPASSDVAERHQSRAGSTNRGAAKRVKLPEPLRCATHLQITPWMLLSVSHA